MTIDANSNCMDHPVKEKRKILREYFCWMQGFKNKFFSLVDIEEKLAQRDLVEVVFSPCIYLCPFLHI